MSSCCNNDHSLDEDNDEKVEEEDKEDADNGEKNGRPSIEPVRKKRVNVH